MFPSVFNILRIFAVWGKNWYVALSVGVIGLGITGIGLAYLDSSIVCVFALVTGNTVDFDSLFHLWLPHRVVFLPSALAAEILVAVLTIIKTRRTPNVSLRTLRVMLNYLSRALATMDALTLALMLGPTINSEEIDLSTLPLLIDTTSAILITRFILNLRSIDLPRSNVPGEYSTTEDGRSVWRSCLRFADQIKSFNIVANIGAPLDHGEEAETEYPGDIGISELDEDQEHPAEVGTTQEA
ncbi:hypothetical protein NLI96_g3439 [Meripilus lineatus]|uniref:Uncharacterized protein n=1 Tax=Meripilus lineatus TaxID=2056292 RepID=A0AAD5V8X9_9APHY|nr:hypothetical protein NLI96_g3439 [Physisporinus lineatus]